MGLIKKADVKAYFVARRGMGILAAEEAIKRVRDGFSNVTPAGAGVNSTPFLEDFSAEHSSHGPSIALIPGGSNSQGALTNAGKLEA